MPPVGTCAADIAAARFLRMPHAMKPDEISDPVAVCLLRAVTVGQGADPVPHVFKQTLPSHGTRLVLYAYTS